MKSQKFSHDITSGSSQINLPYQAGLKIHALITKLKQANRPKTELLAEVQNHREAFVGEVEFLEVQGIASALCDVFANGWKIKFDDLREVSESSFPFVKATLLKPSMRNPGETLNEAKARARKGLLVGVEQHLKEKSVQEFIAKVEGSEGKSSILQLIDNPSELSKELERYQSDTTKINQVIDPYIQFVEADTKDKFTGIKLKDLWRYCRLTWSMEYNSSPAREVRMLIRNKARVGHPIMGIAMLTNPVSNLSGRDEHMATTYESFISFIQEKSISLTKLIAMMKETFKEEEGFISKKDFNKTKSGSRMAPSYAEIAAQAKVNREQALENDDVASADYFLFHSKRAQKLSDLEIALKDLKLLENQTRQEKLSIVDVDQNNNFKLLVKRFLTSKRREVISQDVMDVSVCGAIFPYNSLLVGKLVAYLMASEDVRKYVNKKYEAAENIIRSKTAGKQIKKPTNLKGLTTTSLYGVGSSQYNRLKLLKENSGIANTLEWKELKSTEGYGTYHFSKRTKKIISDLEIKKKKFKNVNQHFGEGASPKMRELKANLKRIGFTEDVIKHEQKRRTYFVDLTKDIRESIFLKNRRSKKLNKAPEIGKAWMKRHLQQRICNKEILSSLKEEKIENFLLSNKFKKKN